MKRFILYTIASLLFFFTSVSLTAMGQEGEKRLHQKERPFSHELRVYPNPCKTGKVTLEMADSEIHDIRLINITGKEVLHKLIAPGTTKYLLELHDIPDGIYFLRIITANKEVFVKKLIVSSS